MSTSKNEKRNNITCITRSVLQTIKLGAEVARVLRAGDVIALTGNLGAGKTYFTKGIAKGLEIPEDEVTSPTYKFQNRYIGKYPLNHIDAYRLSSVEGATDTLGDKISDTKSVTVIEWADKIIELVPDNALYVQIEITGARSRKLTFSKKRSFGRIYTAIKKFSMKERR